VPTQRALAKAIEEGFDLVEIAPTAQPPVCKILNFGKYRYEEQQKTKDAKKKQKAVIWKEIRMAPKIDEHDIETKFKAAIRFLDEGDKLKVTVRFRGRENAHPERGRTLLLSIAERLKDHGIIERLPLLEGKQMIMIMNPVRLQGAPAARPAAVVAPDGAPAPVAAARPAMAAAGPVPSAAPRPATPVPSAMPRAATPVPSAAPRPATPVPSAAPRPTTPVPSAVPRPATPVPSAAPRPATPVPSAAPRPTTPVPSAIAAARANPATPAPRAATRTTVPAATPAGAPATTRPTVARTQRPA